MQKNYRLSFLSEIYLMLKKIFFLGESNLNKKQIIKARTSIQTTRRKILLCARSQYHAYHPISKILTGFLNELLTLLSWAPRALCDKILTIIVCVFVYSYGADALKAMREKYIQLEIIQNRKKTYNTRQGFSISDLYDPGIKSLSDSVAHPCSYDFVQE